MRCFSFLLFLVFHPVASCLFGQNEKPLRLNFQNVDWSPDGKYLAFSAIYVRADWSDFQPEKWQLILLDLKKGGSRLLANGALFAAFSPDGRSIAYSKYDSLQHWKIEVQEIKTGKTRQIAQAPDNDSAPSWSPDGRQLVFARRQEQQSELYVVNADGSNLQKITAQAPFSAYNPVWAPTGEQIVYYLEKGDRHDQIYLTDRRGSFQQNLSADTLHNIYPSWTPAGDILYATKNEIHTMNRQGADRQVLAGIASFFARVSRNGKRIAYFPKSGEERYLAVQSFPKGEARRVFDRAAYERQSYRIPKVSP